jgi:protocatechuate 3,4-dioxygenase beta subunit
MDHDDIPVGTILTRRDALRVATAAGVSLITGGASTRVVRSHRVNLIATPEVEEGPFFVDEGLNRKDIAQGTDRKSVSRGSPLALHFAIFGIRGNETAPLRGAHVDVWHADAAGTYSDEAAGPIQPEDTKGQCWLRGYQVAGPDGKVEFRTIYPGWYHSRTLHIHVKLRTYNPKMNKTHEFNTQLFFDEDTNDRMLDQPPYNDRGQRRVRNLWDGLYAMKQADGTMVGSHLHFELDKASDGMVRAARFALALKLS